MDAQIKSNDCGISAVKTIYNIYKKDISRDYIESKIPLNEKGAKLGDLKAFFDQHELEATFHFLDLNYTPSEREELLQLMPFIIPVRSKSNLHYIVIDGMKGDKLIALDPAKGRKYKVSFNALRKNAYFSKSSWSVVETEEKLKAICAEELKEYNINLQVALTENNSADLFNKLSYFSYVKEQFGLADFAAEKAFLEDLISNQDIDAVPTNFKKLKYRESKEKVRIKAPVVLSVKSSKTLQAAELPKEESRNMYWQLFQQLGQFRKLWYIYVFACFFSAATAQLSVFITQILVDDVLPSYNLGTLFLFVFGLSLYRLFDLGSSMYKSFVAIHLRNSLDRYFFQDFDEKLNRFSLPYIHSYKKGDLIERISDSLKLKTFFLKFVTRVLVDVVIAIYSLAILFYINWQLSCIVVIVMGFFYAWFKIITPILKQNERLRYRKKSDFISKMVEKIEGIQVIKAFNIQHLYSRKVYGAINEYLKIQLKNGYVSMLNRLVVAIVVMTSSIFIMFLLTKSAIEDQLISLGQIITFLALSSKIFSSLRGILDENLTLQENEVIMRRYLDFNEKREDQNPNGIREFDIEELLIQNLSFEYQSGEPVLQQINFELNRGDRIKIEGSNGSGKSTFSKILASLYEPNEGEILLNQQGRKFYHGDTLRSKILLVTNEDMLFNESILENISLGRNVDVKRILKYAKQIEFYDFIASKNEGLEYIIHENGKNLSTGQRKKILLLRALLSDAELVILDEVLSGMDKESRAKVEELIQEDSKRTYIVISHEPIEKIEFNRKYKLKDGQLAVL